MFRVAQVKFFGFFSKAALFFKHFRMEEIKTYYKFRPDEIFRRITMTSLATLMIETSKLEYQEEDAERLSRCAIKSHISFL